LGRGDEMMKLCRWTFASVVHATNGTGVVFVRLQSLPSRKYGHINRKSDVVTFNRSPSARRTTWRTRRAAMARGLPSWRRARVSRPRNKVIEAHPAQAGEIKRR
jgi:hypothetical protein